MQRNPNSCCIIAMWLLVQVISANNRIRVYRCLVHLFKFPLLLIWWLRHLAFLVGEWVWDKEPWPKPEFMTCTPMPLITFTLISIWCTSSHEIVINKSEKGSTLWETLIMSWIPVNLKPFLFKPTVYQLLQIILIAPVTFPITTLHLYMIHAPLHLNILKWHISPTLKTNQVLKFSQIRHELVQLQSDTSNYRSIQTQILPFIAPNQIIVSSNQQKMFFKVWSIPIHAVTKLIVVSSHMMWPVPENVYPSTAPSLHSIHLSTSQNN